MIMRKNKNLKFFLTIFILLTFILGVSLILDKKTEPSRMIKMDSLDDISMVIKEGTLTKTGMSIIITDMTESRNTYGGSCEYRIDKKANNKWKELKKINNLPSYLQTFYVDENNKLEMDIDWNETYGKLDEGYYRLVKNTKIENKSYEFTVEFEI